MGAEFPRSYKKALILDELSPPAVIAGFILTEVGVLDDQVELVVRADTRRSVQLAREAAPLFRVGSHDFLNPGVLLGLIKESQLNRHEKASLRQLALAMEPYRKVREDEWWRVGSLPDVKPEHRYLHKLIATTLLEDFGNPESGYYNSSNYFLRHLYPCHPDDFPEAVGRAYGEALSVTGKDPEYHKHSKPVSLQIPPNDPIELSLNKIKSSGGSSDILDRAIFKLNRGKIKFLRKSQFPIIFGGSPHSGKSTAAASFTLKACELIDQCIEDGLINKGEVNVAAVSLDLVDPAMYSILTRERIIRDPELKWSDQLVKKAIEDLAKVAGSASNIIFMDGPGGHPDSVTESLASLARFSILIDKGGPGEVKPWKQFLLGEDLPTHLVYAHSRYHEAGRSSGFRDYFSRSRGDKYNFLQGRVIDLDRKPMLDDEFINFATAVLLFDYLPEEALRLEGYRANLLASIRN